MKKSCHLDQRERSYITSACLSTGLPETSPGLGAARPRATTGVEMAARFLLLSVPLIKSEDRLEMTSFAGIEVLKTYLSIVGIL
jgi:hypothetical protein